MVRKYTIIMNLTKYCYQNVIWTLLSTIIYWFRKNNALLTVLQLIIKMAIHHTLIFFEILSSEPAILSVTCPASFHSFATIPTQSWQGIFYQADDIIDLLDEISDLSILLS